MGRSQTGLSTGVLKASTLPRWGARHTYTTSRPAACVRTYTYRKLMPSYLPAWKPLHRLSQANYDTMTVPMTSSCGRNCKPFHALHCVRVNDKAFSM